jgi:hypothetical protein
MRDISLKELEVRNMRMYNNNWEYVRDLGQDDKGRNIVLGKCSACGREEVFPKALFFRKYLTVPCEGCRDKIMEKAVGLEVEKYVVRYVNNSDPITCTIECTHCHRLYYGVRLDYLVLRRYKAELCSCKKLPKKDIVPVYFRKEK